METPRRYKPIAGTEHPHPEGHTVGGPTAAAEQVTATIFLHRKPEATKLKEVADFAAPHARMSHAEFAAEHGADPSKMAAVEAEAKAAGLEVIKSNVGARSIEVRGTAAAINQAFGVTLHDYSSPLGKYHSHEGQANFSEDTADMVEDVIGLDNRPVKAKRFTTAKKKNPADPANTKPLTPAQVAKLYNFPAGDGAGVTIGIYEMETSEGAAGYTVADLTATMKAFGGGLAVPKPIDVSVDGVTNSGTSDGETGLDITIASAIAPAAKLAVYFTGGTAQSIIHALQRMIHPDAGDPVPSILSISYGWGADDASANSFSAAEYKQLDQLFQDAANLSITVLVSSGDSGCFIESNTQAQTSYPATEPWVIACGGTTVGNVTTAAFDEYVWNDTGAAGPGATGGGISAKFPVPSYQTGVTMPKRNGSGKAGRGIPDISGNASENSGYLQVINGEPAQSVGGTSAVAPLYAGLLARINANLGAPVGFINPILYKMAAATYRDIKGAPGPANNSLQGVTGYPAGAGWDACTGFGSVNGTALQTGLKTAGK
jgi:kumamolisin